MKLDSPSLLRAGLLASVAIAGLAGCASQPGDSASKGFLAPAAKDYPLVGGNIGNQHYSALGQIDTANVKSLGGAWMVHLEDDKGGIANMQAPPVVIDGIIYITTGLQNVFAIDGKTGVTKWKYTPADKPRSISNRGVANGEGKVFTGQGDHLIALDQKTGKLLWSSLISDQPRSSSPGAPAYYDGMVYVGVTGGGGMRGQIVAFEATTGKMAWRFWVVPGPGEKGNETWEGDSWKHGGGPMWMNPSIDPELGLIYYGTGNPSAETDGSHRGGDNLFTSSVLALDLKTGAYRWHYQMVHHDLWDYDVEGAPLLADINYLGQKRKILVATGKTGMVYILDRTNGKPLIGIKETPVPQEPRNKTSKTQPIPIGDSFVPTCPGKADTLPGMEQSCVFGAFWDKAVIIAPGSQGGNAWAPMAFSPQTKLVYISGAVNISAFESKRQEWDEKTQFFKTISGRGYFRPAGLKREGTLTAIDPTTNKIVWQKHLTFPIGTGSGVLSTAGGLLFHGDPDGTLQAYNARNGDLLWKFQTGSGADAPASTYEIDGEQYVAILAGGNPWNISEPGDRLWAFKLGGKMPEASAPKPPPLTHPGGR